MTVLVILHHTAITYGAPGGWFYNELKPSADLSSFLLTLFVATNQAYFMGFFFFLAGYFTPGSLERKGYAQFIGDRCLRLGVPLVAFIVLLGPFTAALVPRPAAHGVLAIMAWIWMHGIIINGPLWFTQALLIFSLIYAAFRASGRVPLSAIPRIPGPVPAHRYWLLSALGVGLAALAIRQFVPIGQNVLGLQLAFFASYIFLFAAGIHAWRHDWLRPLGWRQVRPWAAVAAFAWLCFPAVLVATRVSVGAKANFFGGLSWPAIFYAFWEPFVAWGIMGAWLLLARKWMNGPSTAWRWADRRAYAVYVIHPPVLVGISAFLHPWAAPALVKFGVVGLLSCAASWMVADPLVRMPGVRRVL